MNYFDKFQKIRYSLKDGGEQYILTDITRNVRFGKEFLKKIELYSVYHINDGDTPEKISEKIYGTPHYHWVILLFNEIENWVEEFPLSYGEFENMLNEKYANAPGVGTTYTNGVAYARATTSHYEDENGMIVFYDPALGELGANWALEYIENSETNEAPTRITIYDIEERINEDKRKLKILSSAQLKDVLSIYERI